MRLSCLLTASLALVASVSAHAATGATVFNNASNARIVALTSDAGPIAIQKDTRTDGIAPGGSARVVFATGTTEPATVTATYEDGTTASATVTPEGRGITPIGQG